MSKNSKLKIGIVGCGAIGGSLAKEIVTNLRSAAVLAAIYDIQPQKAQELSQRLVKNGKLSVDSLGALIKKSDLVIEASSGKAAWKVAQQSLSCGRKVMMMSVGGIVDHVNELFALAAKNKAQVYFPSGAISGIDALKAANVAGVKRVVLTTRKNPKAFSGVEYVEKNFKLAGIKKDKVLFSGVAAKAVKYFPQNINVAAVLGLAAIGMNKTQVRIIASPKVKNNIHEVMIESKAAKIFTRTENILHPQNPKTSYLAVLSAVVVLRQILQPIKIGT
ncbi:MAG: aspartate dehydrogenase [Candidatus Omnitrophica bacterium CG11_big_fil_rev_8_21_14_0_20_41_12]|nr:MAG: aspartate dehydrogenase [Candidatus Omnitrophica bacterium CG11_big_fil_rev_8_21_14_0_20_41_12]